MAKLNCEFLEELKKFDLSEFELVGLSLTNLNRKGLTRHHHHLRQFTRNTRTHEQVKSVTGRGNTLRTLSVRGGGGPKAPLDPQAPTWVWHTHENCHVGVTAACTRHSLNGRLTGNISLH